LRKRGGNRLHTVGAPGGRVHVGSVVCVVAGGGGCGAQEKKTRSRGFFSGPELSPPTGTRGQGSSTEESRTKVGDNFFGKSGGSATSTGRNCTLKGGDSEVHR